MAIAKTQTGQPPVWNLQLLLVSVGLGFYAWWWASFSGPFRLLADVELKFFGGYSEPATAVALAVAMLPVIGLPAALLGRAYTDLSEAAASAVAAAVFVMASVAALGQAWHLWHVAGQMPRPSDPVQVVDLARIGTAPPPTGHVRLIGTPDRPRQVLIQSTGRRSLGNYWEAWVPVTARPPRDSSASIQIVATHRASYPADAAKAVTADPEGVLLADSLDIRTMYEARQEGLDLAEHSFVLYPDDQVQFDKILSAALLGFFVLLFWTLAAYSKIKERRSGITPEALVPASPPEVEKALILAPVDALAAPAPKPTQPADGLLTRVGIRAAVASTLAGGALWEAFGFPLTVVQLLAYLAAGLAFGVSGLLIWFGQRHDDATQEAARPPKGVATMDASAPSPGVAQLYVLRDESGFSSPSYTRVDVDGTRVADLRPKQYTAIALPPGSHTLAVNTRVSLTHDTVAQFDVAAGDIVAYRLQIRFFGPMRLKRTVDIPEMRVSLKRLKLVQGNGSVASKYVMSQSDVDLVRRNSRRALYGELSAADCSTWLAKGWIRRVEVRGPLRVHYLRTPSFMWTDALIQHLERIVISSDAAEQPDGFIGVVLMVVPKGGAFLSHIAHVVPHIRGSAEQAASDAEIVVVRWLSLNPTLMRR